MSCKRKSDIYFYFMNQRKWNIYFAVKLGERSIEREKSFLSILKQSGGSERGIRTNICGFCDSEVDLERNSWATCNGLPSYFNLISYSDQHADSEQRNQ